MAFGLETGPDTVVNIKVIGVGGGGNNVVNRMVRSGTKGVDFVAVALFAAALFVLRRWKPNPIWVMAGCGAAGLVVYSLV